MNSFINKYGIKNYIFIIPFALFFILFLVYPIINNFYASFLQWDGLSEERIFIGFNNYINMLKNRVFITALKNNFIFVILAVFIQNLIGFILAIFLNRKMIGTNIYRSIFFIPVIMAPVIIGFTFGGMLNYSFGTINEFFRDLGLGILVVDWLGKPNTVLYAIIFTDIWEWTGISIVLYLAGLQGIPKEIYEAAEIDGSNFFQTLTRITFPMLTSTHFSLLILSSIGALKIFDLVYVMTRGGPAHSSEVLSTYIFRENFVFNHTGYSSAVSIILLILALIVTFFQLRLYRKVRI